MNKAPSLFSALRELKGNQRACVFAEPLWAVPYYLITPFASMYMAAIGLSDAQIGLIASLGLLLQFIWGLLSGAIVDKYGRRRSMLVFGLVCWIIPCGLWAAAQGYWYFLVAVFFNSMWRVTGNSFSCMMVEDGDPNKLVNTYAILNMTGMLAGLLLPIAGLCIDRFTLVPAMRVIYGLSLMLMAVKFLFQYRLSHESAIGLGRMEECKGHSIASLSLSGWRTYVKVILQKRVLLCVIWMTLLNSFNTIQLTFWPLFVTGAYGIADSKIAVFTTVKTAVSLLTYLFIAPRIRLHMVRRPLLSGLLAQALGLLVLLVCLPISPNAVWAVFFSAACDAFGLAMLSPLSESLMSVSLPSLERARMNSFIFAVILLISTPAGWIAGQLSQLSRALPLMLNLGILLVQVVVAFCIARLVRSSARQAADA